MIECSNAIKCPSVNYHLAGSKKIQQELSQPGVLEKFIPDPQKAQRLRKTFAKQYSLEMVNTSVSFSNVSPLPILDAYSSTELCDLFCKYTDICKYLILNNYLCTSSIY